MNKNLYTKEAILNKKELENYLAKLASDNIVENSSSKDTYPIPRMKENCKYISLVYTLLNEHIKLGIPIHPAGEWILDNFYIIERVVKTIEKGLSIKDYTNLPGLSNSGFARIFVLANEIVSNTDAKIEQDDIKDYLSAYQTQKSLTMKEIWQVPYFLQICIIEKIRHICEKIFISQTEKYKVESMIKRIIEDKLGKSIKISVNGAYPFIEYMSYRLKRYGKDGIPYLEAFEEQVNKMGVTVSEVINREHFDIAVKKLSIKNSILSIRDISRMNMLTIFKEINVVENILNKDPAKVYPKMDFSSKDYYRNKISEIAEKTKISEIFIAEEILKLCKNNISEKSKKNNKNNSTEKNNKVNVISKKKSHVGYYLIDDGLNILINRLVGKKIKYISNDTKAKLYVFAIYLLTFVVTILLARVVGLLSIVLFIPVQNAVTQIIQYFLSKVIKPKHIPRIDLHDIDKENATMCAIPVALKSKEDVKEVFRKMEVYYLANKSENLFFTLLGDCSCSSMQEEQYDKEIIKEGVNCSKILNKKYGEIFFFIYRNREWIDSERCYMGWERKRGMLNQFNEFLITGNSKFGTNNCNIKKLPKIKYVITIDFDTNLVMDSAFKLIGTMAHILNKPEIDKIKNRVYKGYGIIQPRVDFDIANGRKTLFTRLMSGVSGTDVYANATYDIYQDTFDEGIFTGKGIYDLEVFYEVLKDSIPENIVLSHDLLEGSFLRCGLANDIFLIDGYPSTYNAYKIRKHRWIRGDLQIIRWLNSGLNFLSKYKILDNLVRNSNEIFIFLSLVIGMICISTAKIVIPLILLGMPTIIRLIDLFINKKSGVIKNKMFAQNFTEIEQTIYRYILDIILLPDTANVALNAFAKSFYRMKISHLHLLEWTTAKEAESTSKMGILNYYSSMIFSVIVGIFSIMYPFSLLWIFSPLIVYLMSRKEKENAEKISRENTKYLYNLGEKTWKYFKENMTNFLVNDNYQENRREKVLKRTSSTNIGLELLSIIASYDLGYETKEYVIDLIENVIKSIEVLPKWNGHLYNWYDTENLTPLYPLMVSTVDSGNFVGYLYTLKQFLIEEFEEILKQEINNKKTKNDQKQANVNEAKSNKQIDINKVKSSRQIDINKAKDNKQTDINELKDNKNYKIKLEGLIEKVDKLINDTDFSKLYDNSVGLFSIGFNCEENKLYDSYYDLLASESRQTTLIAIAKKDVPSKSWASLGRTLTALKGHIGLLSWGGTAFEYLMPNIIIPTYDSTLIDESCKLLILSQKEYANSLKIPWGISESSYSLKDFKGNYQYKTFGIPWLGLKRGLANEIVVSPYATVLSLTENPKDAIDNLKRLEKEGALGKYGFYDAIDYLPKKEIIQVFMAHHQGMILASIDNELKNNIFQKRFMKNPEMEGIKVLLQERVPANLIITKEKKEKAQKIKYKLYYEHSLRNTGVNVISTSKYTTINYQNGSETNLLDDNVLTNNNNIYIKDIDSKRVWSLVNSKIETSFKSYASEYKLENGNLKAIIKNTIVSDLHLEVKEIKISNKGLNDLNLEITTSAEPLLVNKNQYEAHPAFENMFIKFRKLDDKLVISRNRRLANDKSIFLVTTLYADEGSMEFEIDKEKFISRKNNRIPDSVSKSWPFSKKDGNVINPIIAMRRIINIKPNDTKKLYLISSAEYNENMAIKNVEEYENIQNLERVFELSKVQTEADMRYLGIKGDDVSVYQKMLKFLLIPNNIEIDDRNLSFDVSNEKIWKYGISGDFPIMLVLISDLNDYYVVKDVLKAYEYFRSKNIKTELVIISKFDIKENLEDSNIAQLLNKREGIFIIKDLSREDKKCLQARASLIIDAHNGALEKQVAELDDSIKSEIYPEISVNLTDETNQKANDEETKVINEKNLELYNGYGGFNNDGSEYWIIQNKDNRLPVAWSNILANKKFGSVVTDSMGGFMWYKNSRTNRITTFSNDSYMDRPSEKFILSIQKQGNKNAKKNKIDGSDITEWQSIKEWTLTFNDSRSEEEYITCFGLGYAKFILDNGIYQECIQYVPINDNCKVSIIKLKNNYEKEILLKIKYDLDLQIGERNSDKRFLNSIFKESLNMKLIKNLKNPSEFIYITSSEKINELNEVIINLKPDEEKEVVFVIGAEETEMKCLDKGTKYITNYNDELKNTKKYWREETSKLTSKTPLKSFDIMQNNWLVYQSLASRMYGKSGFYQASGGYGFRDQLQDSLGMKYVDINILKEQILMCAKHQFYEGDVEHWWHDDSDLGIRTRYSDDLLWLPYAVLEYIDFTGDYSILNDEEYYLKADELNENETDRVSIYNNYENKGTIFEHCIKAIKRASQFGKNGLPLMKSGDWNDGMNKVGSKGIGESVWLGFFLYDILTRFTPLIDYESQFLKHRGVSKEVAIAINDNSGKQKAKVEFIQDVNDLNYKELKEEFIENYENLKKALNTIAWDGRWYKRAFDDDGVEVGSINQEECKIDSVAQSWSVISNAGDNDKKFICLESAENYLIDNDNNLVRLLTPALEKRNLGYISSYLKGLRENGGQYTHECCCYSQFLQGMQLHKCSVA